MITGLSLTQEARAAMSVSLWRHRRYWSDHYQRPVQRQMLIDLHRYRVAKLQRQRALPLP